MRLLLAVIDDLYSFAFGGLFGRMRQTTSTPIRANVEAVVVPPPIPDETLMDEMGDDVVSFRTVGDVFTDQAASEVSDPPYEKNTVMYAGSTEVSVFSNPTQEFDSVIGELSYGDMVMVLEQRGRWASVVYNGITGWVLREDLVDRAAYVYPNFIIGEPNGPEDPNTIRLRGMIKDMFEGGRTGLPLQAPEYVQYRLQRKGLRISWPQARPRVAGLWHKILKGTTGVHVGITPKTGSIMEYMHTEDIGHIAYVEAVFPNETINISEANHPDGGIYNERVLTRDEWREEKPVFIQVT